MLPMRHCGFGRHRFDRPSEPLVGGRWRLDGLNKSCLPALAICLGLAAFSSAGLRFLTQERKRWWSCMSSEHFGQLAWQFERMSGSSGLKVQAAIAC